MGHQYDYYDGLWKIPQKKVLQVLKLPMSKKVFEIR